LVEDLEEKGRENEEPAIDHSDDNYTQATSISGEMENSSNQAETISELEGLHNDASTGDKVDRNETVTGETSHQPCNTVEGSSEENTSVSETGLQDDPSTGEKVTNNKTLADGTSDEPSNDEEGRSEKNTSVNQTGVHDDPLTSKIVERNKTVTGGISHEARNDDEGSRGEVTAVNETDLHDDPSTSEKVERNKTVTGGTSHEPSNDEDGSTEEVTAVNQTGLHDDPLTSKIVERSNTVSGGTSHEPSNDDEGSSQEVTAVNQTGVHDDPSTSEKVERKKAGTDGASHEPSNDEEGSSAESASQVPLDATSPSPKEIKTRHSVATAMDGTRLKCKHCGKKQGFSQNCVSCDKSFATYFCGKCKLLIEKNVDPYHCDDCGICRGNKADHFHCNVCNVCMALSLKENHKCFADRGRDKCAICLEAVFSGAVILPCHHMIHKDCAEKLFLSGSDLCPTCRRKIFQGDDEAVIVEETAQQTPSIEGTVSSVFCLIGQEVSAAAISIFNRTKRCFKTTGSSGREIEMANLSNTRNATVGNLSSRVV